MNEDYKFAMQLLAEERAEEIYGRDFYDLPEDLKQSVYLDAEREWSDRAADRADYLRKAEREQQ